MAYKVEIQSIIYIYALLWYESAILLVCHLGYIYPLWYSKLVVTSHWRCKPNIRLLYTRHS